LEYARPHITTAFASYPIASLLFVFLFNFLGQTFKKKKKKKNNNKKIILVFPKVQKINIK
jgi:hypothetical protein